MDIATLRSNLGMTQAEFAEKIGTSVAYVAHLERGRRKPSLKLAHKIETLTGATGFVNSVVYDKLTSTAA